MVPRLRLLLFAVVVGQAACTSTPQAEASGIPVAEAAALLRRSADSVDRWDTNGNGLIEKAEAVGIGVEVGAAIAAAIAAQR